MKTFRHRPETFLRPIWAPLWCMLGVMGALLWVQGCFPEDELAQRRCESDIDCFEFGCVNGFCAFSNPIDNADSASDPEDSSEPVDDVLEPPQDVVDEPDVEEDAAPDAQMEDGQDICRPEDHQDDDSFCNCVGPCGEGLRCRGGECVCLPADHVEDDANCGCLGPCGSGEICRDAECECLITLNDRNNLNCGCNGPCSDGQSCRQGQCIEEPLGFVEIQPGLFDMGSPSNEPQRAPDEFLHPVSINRIFLAQRHEVTQGQWMALMGSNPSHFSQCGSDCPVERVNWWEALAYANAMSDRYLLNRCYLLNECNTISVGEGMECESVSVLDTSVYNCEGFRLPTEAEWEFMARGMSQEAFFNGPLTESLCDEVNESLDGIAWYCFNSEQTTHPIEGKAPNRYGLYDTAGNVAEWVWDGYMEDLRTVPVMDPVVAPGQGPRIFRGGAWNSSPGLCRSAQRSVSDAQTRTDGLGFRLVRTVIQGQ